MGTRQTGSKTKSKLAARTRKAGPPAGSREHKLHETADHAGYLIRKLATQAIHSAEELVQKVVQDAKNAGSKVAHRCREAVDKVDDKQPASRSAARRPREVEPC